MKTLDIRVAFSAVDRLTRPTENARRMMGQLGDSIQRTQGAIKNLERHARSFDRAREAANKAGNGIARAQRQLSALQQIQRAGTVLSDKQKKLMNDLSLKLERLNEVRAREVQRMRELGGELRRHGIALSGSDNTIQQAIRRTQQYNEQLERERQTLARVTQARQQYFRAQEMAGKLKAGGFTAVGTAAAGGYAAGRFLQPAVSFGKEMSRVQALTRIDKNSPQFKALREQALKLGSETQFTAGDAASGQAFLAMAGFTPQAIQAALPGVLNLATASGMDLGQTADISSNILTQFGLSADQMNRVGDTLAATFTRTNTDLRGLGETMKYTGPVADSLGLSLEQTAAMTGLLGSMGIRGSDAGTALRSSLSRLVNPPKAAAKALKQLGVETQDAYGNMRPMEDILYELYQATRKYGNAAKVSFFSDIAGQEAYVSLMSLVEQAGEKNLPRLTREIQAANGELEENARIMADNLDGDLKSLNSAWEGLRIRVADLVDGPLRSVTQSFTRVIAKVTALAQAHPELTKQLLIAGGALLAAVAATGALSLATGVLLGPLAKLRLGFALLTGTSGLGRALPLLTQLRGVLGGPLGGIGGWRVLFVGITSGAGRFAALLGVVAGRLRGVQAGLGALRGGLLAAFTSPGGALISLGRGIGILALRLSGLPALWGMVSGAVGALGGALGFLLSPVGLVVATLVGAAVLIWRHWDQLKAVVGGFLSGLWQGLTPLREAVAPLGPIFEYVGQTIGRVWQWFVDLFAPVSTTKDELDKCTEAGRTFGQKVGEFISNLVTGPVTLLVDSLTRVLEKLGLIPSAVERARKKAEELKQKELLNEKAAMLLADVNVINPPQNDKDKKPPVPAPAATAPLTGENTGTMRRLNKIVDNTGGLLDEAKQAKKRTGPGDIIFKNLPEALAVRGEWKEERFNRAASLLPGSVSEPPVRLPQVPSVSVPSLPPLPAPPPVSVSPLISTTANVSPVVKPVVSVNNVPVIPPVVRPVLSGNITPVVSPVIKPVMTHDVMPTFSPLMTPVMAAISRPVLEAVRELILVIDAGIVRAPQPVSSVMAESVAPVISPAIKPVMAGDVIPTLSPVIKPVVSGNIAPVMTPVVTATSRPVVEAVRQPISPASPRPRQSDPAPWGLTGELHIHLHDVHTQNPRELAKMVGDAVRAEMERRIRQTVGSFRDRD
ncbi:TPA: phage tail tape measure protein [Escherichia coli]|nr:phage tail tape measure protein [Escherichia coli]